MDLKMLLLKFGIIAMFYMQTVLLAKGIEDDTMEFSPFTFRWEDAEARCARQGQILVPGRRYRAKLIKRWMEQENVQSVWLNGWRAVSDTTPDSGGKLRTLKVDFSRPQNKELKMVCQLDSAFYDPLYLAKSTEDARTICSRDGAVLADIRTQEDVTKVTQAIRVDTPNWVNSISSQGSPIKQCLVANRIGDDLKYVYDDCSKEYSFICVTDNDLIASFSPLISLKLARYEEFEEEIEKHQQAMQSSLALSSSMEWFETVSSIDMSIQSSPTTSLPQSTPTVEPSTTPIEVPLTTATDVPIVVTPTVQTSVTMTTKQSMQVTSSVLPDVTSVDTQTESTTSKIFDEVMTSEVTTSAATTSEVMTSETTTSEVTTSETTPSETTTSEATTSETTTSEVTTSETTASEMTSKVMISEATSEEMTSEVTTPYTLDGSVSERYSVVASSAIDVDMTQIATKVDPQVTVSQQTSEITASEMTTEVHSYVTSDTITPAILETTVPEITSSTIPSVSPDFTEVLTSPNILLPSEVFTEDNLINTAAVSTSDTTQKITSVMQSISLQDFSPSTTPRVTDTPFVDGYVASISVAKTESELHLQSTPTLQRQISDSVYQTSASEAMPVPDKSYISMSKDFHSVSSESSVYSSEKVVPMTSTDLLRIDPTTTFVSPPESSYFSVIGDKSDHYDVVTPDDLENETTVQSSPLEKISVPVTDYTTETEALMVVTPIVSGQSIFEVSATPSYTSGDTQMVTTLISSKLSMDVDIPVSTSVSTTEDMIPQYTSSPDMVGKVSDYTDMSDYTSPAWSESTSDMEVLTTSESTTTSYECMVIDSTSYCPDTSSAAHTAHTSDLTTHIYTSEMKTVTDRVIETSLSSPLPLPTSFTFVYDTDKGYTSSKTPVDIPISPTTEQIPTSSIYYDDYYDDLPDSEEGEDDDVDDEVDEVITGEIDTGEDDEDYEANNSVDTGEVVGENTEEEGGIEPGLWVAFGILIALVLISLIVAFYLYRRRKMQKSKDISTANGAAAAGGTGAGETVELRDSRSPSRENGKPRESTTFKDPAYDI